MIVQNTLPIVELFIEGFLCWKLTREFLFKVLVDPFAFPLDQQFQIVDNIVNGSLLESQSPVA